MKVSKHGRRWQIGTIRDVDWIANGTTPGTSIIAAIPPIFEAYANLFEADGVSIAAHERSVVDHNRD